MFQSQPPRSHARRTQGKKERGSFLPFTMETALYPKNCKCSAAVSLPPPPRLQQPHQPPTAHVSPQLLVLPSIGHSQLIQHRPQEQIQTAEHLLLSKQPPEPPPRSQITPFAPLFLPVLPILRALFLTAIQAGAGSIARYLIPTNTLKSPKGKKEKSKKFPPPPPTVLTFRAGRKDQAEMHFTGQEHL